MAGGLPGWPRRMKVWQLTVILALMFVALCVLFAYDLPKEKPHSQSQLILPLINVQLSRGLSRKRGSTFKGTGKITTRVNVDNIECVNFHATTPPSKICIYSQNKDNLVSGSLAQYGTYESDKLHQLELCLSADRELGLIDIGANLGMYTLKAAAMGRNVLAIDAFHNSVIRLQKSVRKNRFLDRVTIVEAAVTSQKGYSFMFVPHGNAAGAYPHQIPKEFITKQDIQNHRVVKNIFVNDLFRFIDFNKAVIRIDIGDREPILLANSRLFEIIFVANIFMNYKYHEKLRKPILIALEEIKMKGFIPKTYKNNYTPLDIGEFEKWPSHVIWVRK